MIFQLKIFQLLQENGQMNIEEKIFINKMNKKVGKTINQYGLIDENDRILVGLSGGKDSFTLLQTISERRKHLPINYDVFACHVNITNLPDKIDIEYLQNFCDKLNVPFKIVHMEMEIRENTLESPCYYCSSLRRSQLFALADELKCNKLALGHHLDDIIETLFMNMAYHGKLYAMPAKLSMFNGTLHMIRPLSEMTEEQTKEYARIMQYKPETARCPYGKTSTRKTVKDIVEELGDLIPAARQNIFKSMSNINFEYLPQGNWDENKKLNDV